MLCCGAVLCVVVVCILVVIIIMNYTSFPLTDKPPYGIFYYIVWYDVSYCNRVSHMQKGETMSNTRLKQKYAEVKKRLHICSPLSTEVLKTLMNYYYSEMIKRGLV